MLLLPESIPELRFFHNIKGNVVLGHDIRLCDVEFQLPETLH